MPGFGPIGSFPVASLPGPSASQIVQFGKSAVGNTAAQVTFAVTPKQGNLLIAIGTWWTGHTAASDWTLDTDVGATYSGVALYYKYAGAGESTTQTPFASPSTNDLSCMIWEVSGMSGTWTTDKAGVTHGTGVTGSTSFTEGVSSTAADNVMILGLMGGDVSVGTTVEVPNVTGGTSVQDENLGKTPGVSTRVSWAGFHDFQATAGTSTSYTCTWATQTQEAELYFFLELNWKVGPAPGPTRLTVPKGDLGFTGYAPFVPPSVPAGHLGFTGHAPHFPSSRAIVQFDSNFVTNAAATVVMSTAPLAGNLLIASMVSYDVAMPNTADGWTLIAGIDGISFDGVYSFYKYAGVGESTSQTPTTATGADMNIGIWEVSGMTGTWSDDYQGNVQNAAYFQTGPTFDTPDYTTTADNSMLLCFLAGIVAIGTGASYIPTLTGTTDGTNAGSPGSRSDYPGSWNHELFPTTGDDAKLGVTYPSTISFSFVSSIILNWGTPPVPVTDDVSKLTTYAVLHGSLKMSMLQGYAVMNDTTPRFIDVPKLTGYTVLDKRVIRESKLTVYVASVEVPRVTDDLSKLTSYAVVYNANPHSYLSYAVPDVLCAGASDSRLSIVAPEALSGGNPTSFLSYLTSDVLTGGNPTSRCAFLVAEALISVPREPYMIDPSTHLFPTMRGLTFDVKKKPGFLTGTVGNQSGREVRLAFMQMPRWDYVLSYEFLFDIPTEDETNDLQGLCGFFLSRQGSFDAFLFLDPDDNSVVDSLQGVGDGAQTNFFLMRNFGGFNEIIGQLNQALSYQFFLKNTVGETHSVPASAPYTINATHHTVFQKDFGVKLVAGGASLTKVSGSPATGEYAVNESTGVYTFNSAQASAGVKLFYSWELTETTDYTILMPNELSFVSAPAAGFELYGTFGFYFTCRFTDDAADFDKFYDRLWELKSLPFKSILG